MADNQKQTPPSTGSKIGKRRVIALLTGAGIVVSGVFGVQALTSSKTYAHMKAYTGGHGGWHRGGWRGKHHQSLKNMSDSEIEAQINRVVRHVSIEIDATPEQTQKITSLLSAVAKDLKPVRARMEATWGDVHNLLLADQIDREALERIRTQRLAEAEQISKNLVNAVADVAEVLTPQQRKLLDERIKEFRAMRKG